MSLDINDYLEQLKQLCDICVSSKRCKDKNKVCLLKRQTFTLAKWKLKRREKVGVENNECR